MQARQQGGRRPQWWTAALSTLLLPVLVLALLLPIGGCAQLAGQRQRGPARAAALPATAPAGRLQEVEPPAGVRELSAALAVHRPRLRITAPEPGRVLGAGPWRLALQLDDWPLVNAGTLGLGTHLVVQVDRQPPLRISDWSAGDPASGRLELELPELTPGSHQITVYVARPWGEAVKSPGASAQLLVHRLSADPLSLPPADSPRLLPVSPAGLASAEPVLIDWLLENAPLQGLRDGDGQWRLRITINGDSFLVDQNTPLWLKGFRNGSNAVLFELLDGLGDPLNPPFNSAVREVVIDAGAPRPAWLQTRLSDTEAARLLGQPAPEPEPEPAPAETPFAPTAPTEPARREEQRPDLPASTLAPATPATETSAPPAAEAGSPLEQPASPAPPAPPAPAPALTPAAEPDVDPDDQTADDLSRPGTTASSSPAMEEVAPASAPVPAPAPVTPAPAASAPSTEAAPLERITPSSSLQGSARDLVRDDGSLIRPQPTGPFSGLRKRLQTGGGEA